VNLRETSAHHCQIAQARRQERITQSVSARPTHPIGNSALLELDCNGLMTPPPTPLPPLSHRVLEAIPASAGSEATSIYSIYLDRHLVIYIRIYTRSIFACRFLLSNPPSLYYSVASSLSINWATGIPTLPAWGAVHHIVINMSTRYPHAPPL